MTEPAPRSVLFVRSIPFEIDNEKLGSFFSDFAPVKHAVVVTDKQTGESKGYGFVSFSSPEDAKEAQIKAVKQQIGPNRYLRIDIAKPRARNDPSRKLDAESLERERRSPRLIVRNCPWSLRDPQELYKIFSKYGKVIDAYIPRGENNKMSGFALVTMKKHRHAKRAIEGTQDLKIHDRPVNVSMALEKEKWLKKKAGESVVSESEPESESESESENESNDKKIKPLDPDLSFESESDFSDEDNQHEKDEKDEEDDDEQEKERKPRGKDNRFTIFVRNVPYDATGDSLKAHFSQFGPVAYALPVMDREKNTPKGTAFVAFERLRDCEQCVEQAPEITSTSLLVPEDVDSRYVYEGRVLNVASAVHKDTAERLTETRKNDRLVAMGESPKVMDKRRLFLLNEGRVGPDSKLAQDMPKAELEIRDKSFQLRKQQLSKNPSLHLSMTRLAIRNIPRAMDEKALKSLARKAVVEFATEVRNGERHPLTKEELMRSIHHQDALGDAAPSKKHGVVRQAKIIKEEKGSGKTGRSRGYGFLEMRNHKAALMALRYLNGHVVTREELEAGEPNEGELEGKRRLVVEFAIENAQVVKRQREQQLRAKQQSHKRKAAEMEEAKAAEEKELEERAAAEEAAKPKGMSIIGKKRKNKKMRKN